MKKIVVVGGGPAAIAISYKLLEELKNSDSPPKIEIIIFEKGDKIGPGLPYSSKDDCYILNLPITVMRANFEGPNKFLEWFATNYSHIQTQFPPRKYFGDFLIHLWSDIYEQFKQKGFSIKYYTKTEVINISEISQGNYLVKTTRNVTIGNYIILCTGHMPNTLYKELEAHPGYRHSQWAEDAFENIHQDQTICIIGSRLSAIDIALKLREKKHKGKIIMFSRSGLLPSVLAKEVPPHNLKYFTMDNFDILTKSGIEKLSLDKLMDLFWKEISEAEGKKISLEWLHKSSSDISALDWLKREIKHAKKGARPWQQVMFSIYPIVPQIWRLLSFSDKKEFMRNYSLYMTYLAAFPLDNAEKIYDMLSREQLEVVGGITSIHCEDNIFVINCTKQTYKSEVLFNATGPGYDPMTVPLYREMSKKGMVVKHHCGGICVNPQTLQVLDKKMNEKPSLYALGELTRGACLATTDMTQLIRQADRVATHLLLSIKSHNKAFSESVDKIRHNNNQSDAEKLSHFGFFNRKSQLKPIYLIGCAVAGFIALDYFRPRFK